MSCLYLHSVVLSVVVSNSLQERLRVVAESNSSGVEFGLVWSGCTQRAAVVFILLFVVVVVDLTGLKASGEDGGLEPFCARTDSIKPIKIKYRVWQRHNFIHKPWDHKIIELTGTFNLHGGQWGAFGQVGGVETQQQPQIPLCVNKRGGETAEVWSGDCLLVRL